MEKLENVRFNRIIYPKGATEVSAGMWTAGTISTGVKKYGKYESINFKAEQDVNIGINTKAKYNLEVYYQNNGKYGQQFVVRKMEMIIDTKTPQGMEQALTLIMTDLMAKRVVEHFKTAEATTEAFENKQTEEFMKIKGITEDKLDSYYKLYEEKILNFEAITKLMPYGFTAKEAVEIYIYCNKDIEKAIMTIEQDVYNFYLKSIVSFETADKIFINKLKGKSTDSKRVGAYIVYCLKNPLSFGDNDSFKTYEQANIDILPRVLEQCGTVDGYIINAGIKYGKSREVLTELDGKIGLTIKYDTEMGIYSCVNELKNSLNDKIDPLNDLIEKHIQNYHRLHYLTSKLKQCVLLAQTEYQLFLGTLVQVNLLFSELLQKYS
ncbi:helix-hairpin-helix domain-containing protein [Rossellomorea marisflavi]|uniref:helix-hairpin-helix domain-containing protein n=1 Tax=Rossellomorea marisflavi TaxID=189381 RepID=UPI0039BF6CAA